MFTYKPIKVWIDFIINSNNFLDGVQGTSLVLFVAFTMDLVVACSLVRLSDRVLASEEIFSS